MIFLDGAGFGTQDFKLQQWMPQLLGYTTHLKNVTLGEPYKCGVPTVQNLVQ